MPSRSAAVAFYTILSLAPGLVIAVSFAGMAVGRPEAREAVVRQLTTWAGADVAATVTSALQAAREAGHAGRNALFGVIAGFFGTTVLFAELHGSLNAIWKIKEKPGWRWSDFLVPRILSFAIILAIGVLIFLSVGIGIALSVSGRILEHWFAIPEVAFQVADWVVSFLLMTLLCSVIFKILPDANIGWRDTWFGAAITSVLFTIGRWAIALYLGTSTVGSIYGASGSLALLLLWVYYSAQVFLLGAEFTSSYARYRGGGIRPRRNALLMPGS